MDRSLPAEFAVPDRVTAFIDGAFRPAGSGHVLPVIYPATEETGTMLEEASADEVDRAARAARRARCPAPPRTTSWTCRPGRSRRYFTG